MAIDPFAALVGLQELGSIPNTNVVAIFGAGNFTPIFTGGGLWKATIKETSRVMEHPVETGATIADFHVIEPKEIEIQILVPVPDFTSTYQNLRSAYLNATLLTVQTKADVYQNMIIRDLPHEEDPDMFDVLNITLHLREVLFVVPVSVASQAQPANFSPANPTDDSTVPRGTQNPQPLPTVPNAANLFPIPNLGT